MSGAAPENDSIAPPAEGVRRVAIQNLSPAVDGGRFPVKRTLGESVVVEAAVFTDGHDAVACDLLYRLERERDWHRQAMDPCGNDRWRAAFLAEKLGRSLYTVAAWVDPLATWREWATDVRGFGIDSGHYLAEEVPAPTAQALIDFFTSG